MEHLIIALIAGVILLLIVVCFVLYMIFSSQEESTEPIPLIKLLPGKPKNIKYEYEPVNPILHSPIF